MSSADEELLMRTQQARDAGAIECSVRHNIFEQRDPQARTLAISRVFRDRWSGAQARAELRDRLGA